MNFLRERELVFMAYFPYSFLSQIYQKTNPSREIFIMFLFCMEPRIYMTPEGAAKLQEELDDLWKVQRPRVTQAVADAAAQGDRTENADYIYGKKKLREIDARVRWIQKRLDAAVIVERKPGEEDKVFFGAYVRLQNPEGRIIDYRLVGPDDLDLEKNMITLQSPIGRALKGKQKGEKVKVRLPRGETEFTILDVSYTPFEDASV
jgi:transcription elongation factor GreB